MITLHVNSAVIRVLSYVETGGVVRRPILRIRDREFIRVQVTGSVLPREADVTLRFFLGFLPVGSHFKVFPRVLRYSAAGVVHLSRVRHVFKAWDVLVPLL